MAKHSEHENGPHDLMEIMIEYPLNGDHDRVLALGR